MEIGIIGLSRSGKSTLFQALTRGKTSGGDRVQVGVAKVPDARLQVLQQIFRPQRVVPAEVKYLDMPGMPEGRGQGLGLKGERLNWLGSVDALLLVLRDFDDPAAPHPEGTIDPHRDLSMALLELALADLSIVENRLQRLGAELKGARPQERSRLAKEAELLQRLKEGLEQEVPLKAQDLTREEKKILAGYPFLSLKPLLLVWNIAEERLEEIPSLEEEIRSRWGREGNPFVVLCGKLEKELGEMTEEEAEGLRASWGLKESGLRKVLNLSYEALGLISFFTVASGEVRAWSVPRDTPAVKAAGKIHSDMERGFIRAEVIRFEDLALCGSVSEGRKRGLLRLEGKTYPVQDGDVITFLFNV